MFSIYKITNTINGKYYIGFTSLKPEKRFRLHATSNNNYVITRAIKKYGRDNFIIDVLFEFSDRNDALNKEGELIESLNPQYNMCPGGLVGTSLVGPSNGMYGKKHSNEWKAMRSEAMKGSKNPMYGNTHTKEAKEKIIAAKLGAKPWNYNKTNVYSAETLQKMRQPKSETAKQNMRNKYKIGDLIIYNAKQYCVDHGHNYGRFTQAAKKSIPYKGMIIHKI